MKRLIISGFLLALTACSESINDQRESLNDNGLQLSIDGITPNVSNALMKSSFDPDDKLTLLAWNEGDTDNYIREDFLFSGAKEAYSEEVLAQNVATIYPTSLLEGIDDFSSMLISHSNTFLYSKAAPNVVMKSVNAQLNFSIVGEIPTQNSIYLSGELSQTANFNLFTGDLSPSESYTSSITFVNSGTVSSLYSTLIIPQTLSDFTLTCGDNTYLYGGDVEIAQGDVITLFVELIPPTTDGDFGKIEIGKWSDGDDVEDTFDKIE